MSETYTELNTDDKPAYAERWEIKKKLDTSGLVMQDAGIHGLYQVLPYMAVCNRVAS